MRPVTDIAATTVRSAPKMGAATQQTPTLASSRSKEMPACAMDCSSRRSFVGEVMVAWVSPTRPLSMTSSMSVGVEKARIALPNALA